MSSNITCKKDLLMTSLTDFYKKKTNIFEQISKVSGLMQHNGGLLFRNISETEFEFITWGTIPGPSLPNYFITDNGIIDSNVSIAGQNCNFAPFNDEIVEFPHFHIKYTLKFKNTRKKQNIEIFQ